MKRFLTTQELLTIYHAAKDGHRNKDIAKDLGLKTYNVVTAVSVLNDFLSGKQELKQSTKLAYKQAYSVLKKGKPMVTQAVKPTAAQVTDNLRRLEEAFSSFQSEIAEVIIAEVNQRAEQKVKAKEEEIATVKEKYETELQKLQAIILEMKGSSVVGMIKRKWQGV